MLHEKHDSKMSKYKSAAKTNKQRQAKHKAKRLAEGYKQYKRWVKSQHVEAMDKKLKQLEKGE